MTREEHLAAIKKADREYYELDNPVLADEEYDALRRSYIDKYGAEDLNYVPGSAAGDFDKFSHPHPVTSLSKWTKGVDSEADLVKKVAELWPVVIQPKYDGLTVVAYPNADGSCRFVTRGLGGRIGEVLPNFISRYEGAGVNNSGFAIRGEVYITQENFAKMNAELTVQGEEPMKNMRNAAAGILRRKERSPFVDYLSYVCYEIPGEDITPLAARKIIAGQTAFTATDMQELTDADNSLQAIENYYASLKGQNIPIDGIVIKSCQENSLAKFGYTAHHPRNGFAYKALSEKFVTVVRDVIWQMGRRKATPVAVVDPVEIDGATVTRASLHNAAMIKELGIKIGATVEIHKANEIIPQITRVLEEGTGEISLAVCPSCGQPLEEVNGQQFCVNPACDERLAQDIAFLGSKDVLNIDGLSIETARKMVAYAKIQTPAAELSYTLLFTFTVEMIESLEGFARKSAEKLYGNIQTARQNVGLPRFIKALCLPGIGSDVGKILADNFGDLSNLADKIAAAENPQEMLQEINGIGPKTAEILTAESFMMAVRQLEQYVSIAPYVPVTTPAGDYAGKIFVLTGKMAQPRSYYVELIESAGGKEGKAVSSKTDYLVIQDVNSTSSKAVKAREVGTKLISPEELVNMLSQKK
ncbi:BRCT domain-containing protein [Selenomonas sp. AE3005]|uniref:BRCT domain-containing protein n=1 Tax=Selenomonas sp. AE3005 TaxID=1485543 RepID=UPI0025F02CD0|nr:BRCT domain-containing protein [Selenomonas sp. AE3005]